jgi:formylglycine-generating enzyme
MSNARLSGVLVSLVVALAFITPVSAESVALKTFKDCDECSEMVVLPAGKYMMGATKEEFEGQPRQYQSFYDSESPRHAVDVKSFAVGRYHVTRGQFAVFAKETGFRGKGCRTIRRNRWADAFTADWQDPGFPQTENDPVVCVSWDDAQQYIAWLNKRLAGKTAHRYRLPTEQEWEYAARAGTTTPMYWGTSRHEQCVYENARDQTALVLDPDAPVAPCNDHFLFTSPAGSFKPNPWGLYDMLGNALQWMSNCSSETYTPAPAVFALPDGQCRSRKLRGASWADIPIGVRAAARVGDQSDKRNSTQGFRLVVGL